MIHRVKSFTIANEAEIDVFNWTVFYLLNWKISFYIECNYLLQTLLSLFNSIFFSTVFHFKKVQVFHLSYDLWFLCESYPYFGLPWWLSGKESACQ